MTPDITAGRIWQQYCDRTPGSAEAYRRASRSLAGGTTRQAGHWLPHPLTIVRGQGATLWDLDGHCYLDIINNYTSLVHGHAYPPVTAAIEAQARLGTAWSANCLPQLELAELLCERVRSVAALRFTNSGTEAANLALLIAREVTGRDKVLMARFGYHGSVHEFELGHFGREGPMTRLGTYGDASSFEAVLAAHGNEIAAVFLEPVMGSGGVVGATREFLEQVQDSAHRAGALFVLDEVVSLRLGTGGLQGLLGFEPDLTMMGKLIGGGLPVGAVGGKREFMRVFDPPEPRVYHTGTFAGNPLTMAAGLVSVRELTPERIETMDGLTIRLQQGLHAAARMAGVPLSSNRVGSLLQLFFSEVLPPFVAERADLPLMGRFHLAALNRGLLLAPRGMVALSTVMTAELVDQAVERAAAAMRDVAIELPTPGPASGAGGSR